MFPDLKCWIDVYTCMRLYWLWLCTIFLVLYWPVCANSGGARYARPSELVSPKREYLEPSLVLVCVVAQAASSHFEREDLSLK